MSNKNQCFFKLKINFTSPTFFYIISNRGPHDILENLILKSFPSFFFFFLLSYLHSLPPQQKSHVSRIEFSAVNLNKFILLSKWGEAWGFLSLKKKNLNMSTGKKSYIIVVILVK